MAKPVKHNNRYFTPKMQEVINKEVRKLMDAFFISEVIYPN